MAHIQIIEKEEVKMDLDTKGIIAVVDAGDKVNCAWVVEDLTGEDILNMLDSLDNMKQHLLKAHPELGLVYLLSKKVRSKADEDDSIEDLFNMLKDEDDEEDQ